MRQILWIDGPLPGLNEIIDQARKNRYASASQKKRWTKVIALEAKFQELKPVKRAVFRFTWQEKSRRRDPDNIAAGKKFIFDGLVQAGIMENDGWKQVIGWKDKFYVSEIPGVFVEIKEDL